jgi:hypothetical protein
MVLGRVSDRLGSQGPRIGRGFDESGAKISGLIERWIGKPNDWSAVILTGPQIGVATPFFKQPPDTGTGARPQDLTLLPVDAVPGTSYRHTVDRELYQAERDRWVDYKLFAELQASADAIADARLAVSAQDGTSSDKVIYERIEAYLRERSKRPYTEFYRLAWRRRIADDTDRSLFAAIVPPGPAHVHLVHSLAMPENRQTALVAGFWAALPLDYLLRTTGTRDLQSSAARLMPTPVTDHPLASALLLRILRLNCLTSMYSPLWAEVYERSWRNEQWVVGWPKLAPLGRVLGEWTVGTALRTEMERRAALVEIDALVSVWLGLSADHLETIYRSRYPVMSDYEDVTWFDAKGRKIAGNWNTFGHGQTKEHWQQLAAHLEEGAPPPEGYSAPFYKADRVGEMRRAHEVFSRRLAEASGWARG